MRYRVMLAALVMGAASLPAPIGAQARKPITFGISGGPSIPIGLLRDDAEPGYAVSAHLNVLRPTSRVRFRGDATYARWKLPALVGANREIWRTNLGLLWNAVLSKTPETIARRSARPYLLGGVGMFKSGFVGEGSADGSSLDLSMQAGGGIEFGVSGVNTFVEGKVVNVFAAGGSLRHVPITLGVRF